MMVAIIIIFVVAIVVTLLACCRVSGICSRAEEQDIKAQLEKDG